jgi:hypothetical protein
MLPAENNGRSYEFDLQRTLSVHIQGTQPSSSQGTREHKIKAVNSRQLVTNHAALHQVREILLHGLREREQTKAREAEQKYIGC